MCKTLRHKQWQIDYDADATQRVYVEIDQGGPERCGCNECRNFILARQTVYTAAFLDFLKIVGVDYRKEAEVFHFSEIAEGLHLYGGIYHFIGHVKVIGEFPQESDTVAEPFQWELSNGRTMSHKSFSSNNLVQIDFTAKVPWLLLNRQR